MRRFVLHFVFIVSALPAAAQQLAERVASVANGEATFSYAARPDVCGDGRSLFLRWFEPGSQMVIISSDMGTMTTNSWDTYGQTCLHGPVRVQLSVRDRQVVTLRPFVGGSGSGRGRDLGTVGTREAAAWLLAIARPASEDLANCALLAAVLADSVTISPQLVAMADDRRLGVANREE